MRAERRRPSRCSPPLSVGGDWLSVQEAADRLGLQFRTVYYLIDRGELPASFSPPSPRPKGGRRVVRRIRRQDLDEYIERARVKPGELAHLYGPGEGESGTA